MTSCKERAIGYHESIMTGYPQVVWVVLMRYDKVMDFLRVIVFFSLPAPKG
jgi:hypothetical protein